MLLFLFLGMLSGIPNVSVLAHGMSVAPLLLGETHLIGQVNVLDLPSTSGNVQTHVGDPNSVNGVNERAFQPEKMQTSDPGLLILRESRSPTESFSSASASNNSLGVSTGLILEGVSGDLPNPCACTPPDPNLGVGPGHVFEMVNAAGVIYAKNGTLVKGTFSLATFFNLPGSSVSDPQVFYDSASGRWFASILDLTNPRVQFAVSTTSDPTGTFHIYSVSSGRSVPDQPFIGTNDDKFVISANDFSSSGTTFLGVQYWVLNKSELVSGASSVHFVTSAPDTTMFTLRPVRHLTSTTIFYMITNCLSSCILDPVSTTSSAELIAISGVPPATVTVTVHTFSISTSTQPPNAVQAGTSTLLTTNDNRILSAVWESNTLWFTGGDSCTPSGDNSTRSCLRLIMLTTSGTVAPSKAQDFDYSSKGEYLYYPALTLSQGQLAVVYGRSSSSTDPSILAAGRLPNDPVNILEASVLVRSGSAPDTSTRYGDYFGAATDPTPSPSSTFWVAGEYRKSAVSASWNTAIAQLTSLPIPVSVRGSVIFQGYNITTTGTVTVNLASSTFSGMATVRATNGTSGLVVFNKTYPIPSSTLRGQGSIRDAVFLLNVPVVPYSLSVNVDVNVKNGTGTSAFGVSRQIDINLRGHVDIVDAGVLAFAFDSTPLRGNWNPRADFDADGLVDITDAATIAFLFDAPDFI
jgi:hypothetical protein